MHEWACGVYRDEEKKKHWGSGMCEEGDDMSKNCRIEFVEGELTCLCNHRDYRNCDLYEEDEETYDGCGEEEE